MSSAVATIESQSNPEAEARLLNSPEYRALTVQQQTWILAFITTGSALAATRLGYAVKETNARPMSYSIASNKSIVAALNVYTGSAERAHDEREALITTVRQNLAAAVPGSEAAANFTNQLIRLQLSEEPEEK